eukprot:755942-Rhodomonas_salina.1
MGYIARAPSSSCTSRWRKHSTLLVSPKKPGTLSVSMPLHTTPEAAEYGFGPAQEAWYALGRVTDLEATHAEVYRQPSAIS